MQQEKIKQTGRIITGRDYEREKLYRSIRLQKITLVCPTCNGDAWAVHRKGEWHFASHHGIENCCSRGSKTQQNANHAFDKVFSEILQAVLDGMF